MMKRSRIICAVLMGLLLFSGCSASGQKTDPAFGPESSRVSSPGGPETEKDGQEEQTDKKDDRTAVEMKGLMQGELGGIGSGFLAYTLPEGEDKDYTLCFFKEGSRAAELETGKAMAVVGERSIWLG